jgi:hypothetical protein
MIDANFRSSIYLKNGVENAPITVTPILYLSNGKKYVLPDVALEPSGTAVVNVNDALREQGIASWATLFGYVQIEYTWGWDAICATIQNVDTVDSLIFTYGLRPAGPRRHPGGAQEPSDSKRMSRVMEGMWWKPENGVAGFGALSNTAEEPLTAKVQVSDTSGNGINRDIVTVSPHGTKIVKLAELLSVPGSQGGITVTYDGPADGLAINGGLEDQATGYSANIHFFEPPDSAARSTLASYAELGLMSGAADPMLSFPAGTVFTPYSVVRNVSDLPISISATLWWMEAGTARSAPVPKITVLPKVTQSLDLHSMMSAAGLKNFNGSFNLILDVPSRLGGLLMASGSVVQSHTYVFEVLPNGVGESMSKSLAYWSTAKGDDTMVTLWNPADEGQDFIFTLFFSGGSYKYPIHLEPRATRMFNVSEISSNQIPDVDGNLIPATVHEGSAEIAGAQADNEQILIAWASGTYNVRKGTCGPHCYTCNGVQSQSMQLYNFGLAMGSDTAEHSVLNMNNGQHYDYTARASWSSSNTSVATVAAGNVHGVNIGSMVVSAVDSIFLTVYWSGCPSLPHPCATKMFSTSSPATVGQRMQLIGTACLANPNVPYTADYSNIANSCFKSVDIPVPSGGTCVSLWDSGRRGTKEVLPDQREWLLKHLLRRQQPSSRFCMSKAY